MPDVNNKTEESGVVFEKIGVRPMLYYASITSFILFAGTGWFVYPSGLHIFSIFPFFVSYVFSYLCLYVIVFLFFVLSFRNKSLNMSKFANVKILGLHPVQLVNRTGVKFIDFFGLIVTMLFSLESLLVPGWGFLFPGFLFLALSFLSAIISGSSKKWKMIRRETRP